MNKPEILSLLGRKRLHDYYSGESRVDLVNLLIDRLSLKDLKAIALHIEQRPQDEQQKIVE